MRSIGMAMAALALHEAQGSAGCAQNFSQCNGQNWPYSVCCVNDGFVCTSINDDLSLCLATPVQHAHEAGTVVGDGVNTRQRRLRSNAAQSEATGATGAAALTSQESSGEPNGPVAYLGQCGGLGYSGPTMCTHGQFCHVESPYYSSCLFNPTDDAHVGVWRKCGGANWSGQTRCQEGSTCQVQTVWYSQCVPLV